MGKVGVGVFGGVTGGVIGYVPRMCLAGKIAIGARKTSPTSNDSERKLKLFFICYGMEL